MTRSCEQVERELAAALDGEPESLATLRHVKLCARCAATARELARLDEELHESLGGIEEAPAGFVHGVLSRLPAESPEELAERRTRDRLAEVVAWLLAGGALYLLLEHLGLVSLPAGWEAELTATTEALAREGSAGLADLGAWLAASTPSLEGLPLSELDPWLLGGGLVVGLALQVLALQGLAAEKEGA